MTGLREREGGAEMERAFFGGIIDKINALAFIPFIRMKASILPLFPFFPCASVGGGGGGGCTVSRSERKGKRGVKLTSSSENSTVDLRDVQMMIWSDRGPRKEQNDTLPGRSVPLPTSSPGGWNRSRPVSAATPAGEEPQPQHLRRNSPRLVQGVKTQ